MRLARFTSGTWLNGPWIVRLMPPFTGPSGATMPLADADACGQLLALLSDPAADVTAWLTRFAGRAAAEDAVPVCCGRDWAAQAWAMHADSLRPPGEGRGDRLPTAALFLAGCLWRRFGSTPEFA